MTTFRDGRAFRLSLKGFIATAPGLQAVLRHPVLPAHCVMRSERGGSLLPRPSAVQYEYRESNMPRISPSHCYIRLLAQALEGNLLIRKTSFSLRAKSHSAGLQDLFRTDLDLALQSLEPINRLRALPQRKVPEQRNG